MKVIRPRLYYRKYEDIQKFTGRPAHELMNELRNSAEKTIQPEIFYTDTSSVKNVWFILLPVKDQSSRLVGFCECSLEHVNPWDGFKSKIMVHRLCIMAHLQGNGYGSETIVRIIEKGIQVELVVNRGNTRAIKLYHSFGFQERIGYGTDMVMTMTLKTRFDNESINGWVREY